MEPLPRITARVYEKRRKEAVELVRLLDAGKRHEGGITAEEFSLAEAYYFLEHPHRKLCGLQKRAADTKASAEDNTQNPTTAACNAVYGCDGIFQYDDPSSKVIKFRCELGPSQCCADNSGTRRRGWSINHGPYIAVNQIGSIIRCKGSETILCCYAGDLFHPRVPRSLQTLLFYQFQVCPQHQIMLLTSNPGGFEDYLRHSPFQDTWPNGFPNVTFCVSIRLQAFVDMKLEILCRVPAMHKQVWLSPMLGYMKLRKWLRTGQIDKVYITGPRDNCHVRVDPGAYIDAKAQCEECGVPVVLRDTGSVFHLSGEVKEMRISLPFDGSVQHLVGHTQPSRVFDVMPIEGTRQFNVTETPVLIGDYTNTPLLLRAGNVFIAARPSEIKHSITGPFIEASSDLRSQIDPMLYAEQK